MMPPEGPQRACAELAPQFRGACVHQRTPQVERAFVALLRHVDETAEVLSFLLKATRFGKKGAGTLHRATMLPERFEADSWPQ